MDSTEEFRVTTSNGNADSGRSSGAQISLVTKSGTNKFHGSLYEYHRPSNMVANDCFVKNEQIADNQPNRPTKYIVNTFGGSVGGPSSKTRSSSSTTTKDSGWPPMKRFQRRRLQPLSAPASLDTLPRTDPTVMLDRRGQIAATRRRLARNAPLPGVNQAMSGLPFYRAGRDRPLRWRWNQQRNLQFQFPGARPISIPILRKLTTLPNAKNHLFWRGNLQDDHALGAQNLPGQPASTTPLGQYQGNGLRTHLDTHFKPRE